MLLTKIKYTILNSFCFVLFFNCYTEHPSKELTTGLGDHFQTGLCCPSATFSSLPKSGLLIWDKKIPIQVLQNVDVFGNCTKMGIRGSARARVTQVF